MPRLTVKDIATMSGVSTSRVYQLKRTLGRTPTVEEVMERKGMWGAPRKEDSKQFFLKFIGNRENFIMFIEHLKELYGENTTLAEISQMIGALENVKKD